ncbi:DUF4241 domain-containing protein [Streptomyces sp. HPF1205]|uniref:DUF4241 domain-containing protein n=1 Tax=Streptomyces sp. HPF1205 TaxID=2873262 RepID=UPI001CEC21E2|nr:DUF4241 domain-containing protein [Streptomyces sp. HPF1205]
MTWAADPRLAAGPEVSRYLDSVFVPGTRLGMRYDDPRTPVEVVGLQELTSIRIPSGRLVVDTPWPDDTLDPEEWERQPARELVERIPAGTYRVEAAWVQAPYEFMDEHFDGREVAGTRLMVTEEPVASWEVALAVSDAVDRLTPDAEVGFETDTATGCFADATAWLPLTAPFRDFWTAGRREPGVMHTRATQDLVTGYFERSTHTPSAADLVTFPANEGLTRTYLGRTSSGSVAQIAVVPQLIAMPKGVA